MKPRSIIPGFCLLVSLFLFSFSSFSQIVPVSLDQRVGNSPLIAIVSLKEQSCYWDLKRENIYTRNVLEVRAYLKGATTENTIVAISPGGIVGNQAEHVCPAETYQFNTDYLVLLKADNNILDDKAYRNSNPGIKQCLSYAGLQSVLPYIDDMYRDVLAEAPMTEEQLLGRMKNAYGLEAKRPDGSKYNARSFNANISQRVSTVTSITDGTGSLPATGFVASTIPANNQIIINGSGFGATAGTVRFSNANDGGATTVTTTTNDIVSWSATQVRVKIPDLAGTGTVSVFDNTVTNVGSSPITIKWGEINTSNIFLNHASAQRQQVRLLNRNGLGGYTFQYSSNTGSGPDFSADANAKAAFQRAIRTWRCASLVNFNVNSNGSNAAGYVNDDINIVMYDNVSLPAGALAVCTSRFTANGVGGLCDLFNTVWYLKEMDIRVLSIPVPTYTWNFTTGAPTSSQFDFESVMVHEVGHGHGLAHVIAPSLTMHYAISNGSSKRSLSATEIEAGQYRITVSNSNCLNTNGFGGFLPHTAVAPASCLVILPLTLLDFSGQKVAKRIDLQWTSENEQNTKGFHVERSTDGQNFSAVGFVPSTNNATGRNTYTFTDPNNFPYIVYYRLRIEDIDNSFTYSKKLSFKPELSGWKLYPNPTKDKIYLVANQNQVDKFSVQVTDLAGRTVLTEEYMELNAGMSLPVNLRGILPGIYIVKVVSGDQVLLIEKLNKQ